MNNEKFEKMLSRLDGHSLLIVAVVLSLIGFIVTFAICYGVIFGISFFYPIDFSVKEIFGISLVVFLIRILLK